jgi:hypothetical protein
LISCFFITPNAEQPYASIPSDQVCICNLLKRLMNSFCPIFTIQLQGSDFEAGEDSEECEMPLLFWPPPPQTSVSEPLNWDPSGASLSSPTLL